jgi:hypothetical protein
VSDDDKLIIENDVKMSDNGTLISGTARIVDSLAPVIMSAQLVDYVKPEEGDTLTITFSEKVDKIAAQKPFLFHSAKEKKVYDAALKLLGINGKVAVFTVLSLGNNMKIVNTGDSVNIYKNSMVSDSAGNQQDNPDNIRRKIDLRRILELKEAIYFDNNADGRIDSIFIGIFGEYEFTEDDLSKLRDQIKLPNHREFMIKKVNALNNGFSFNVSQKIFVPVNTAVSDRDKLGIDGDIALAFDGTLTKKPSMAIIDSMAPVIMHAKLVDYMRPEISDTFTVTFSERIDSITTEKPFLFYSINEKKVYDATLRILSQSGDTAIFMVVSFSDNMKRISLGDSVNIFKDGKIFDLAGNQQDNPGNIRREVELEWIPSPFNIEIISSIKTANDEFMVIQVRPRGLDYTSEFDSLSAVFDIYDPVGNILQKKLEMNFLRKNGKMYLEYFWNCRNLISREVGGGSYLGVFHVTSYFKHANGDIISLDNYIKLKYLAVQD